MTSCSHAQVPGLLARLAQGFLSHRTMAAASSHLFVNKDNAVKDDVGAYMPSVLEYIESPLQQMKRAGMGMLSMGLGRLGFGGPAASSATGPHPGDQDILVICVVGGVSYKEVGQVQSAINKHYKETNGKQAGQIILLSTKTITPEHVFHMMYNP